MKKYRINHLDCPNCASALQEALQKSLLVKEVLIDFSASAIYLDTSNLEAVKEFVGSFEEGVTITKWEEAEKEGSLKKEIFFLASLIGSFFVCLSLSSYMPFFIKFCLYGIYIVAGIPVFKGAYKRLKKKEFFDENFLMFFATISAFCIGAEFEAVAVMLFFRVGEFFENLAVRKSRKNIQALMDFNPTYAYKKDSQGEWQKVSPSLLQVGDRVQVRGGEKIPSDGVIIKGESEVEEGAINGESMPRFCRVGDEVFGGSINLLGVLEIEIKKSYKESTIAQIIALIENASAKKAYTEKRITSFAKIYTPCVFFLSCLIAILPPLLGYGGFQEWIYRALVVLMVSCPCALVLSVPLGYFGGIGGASKRGILIKGANYLEALSEIRCIAFDKTGTLTKGEFEVEEIVPYGKYSQEELLSIAMCAEHLSNHPIAKSLQKKAQDLSLSHFPISHHQIAGKGMNAECCGNQILVGNLALLDSFGVQYPLLEIKKSVVHIALNGEYAGYIALRDALKENAKEVIAKLQKRGIEVMILSGDQPQVLQEVAQELRVCKAYGGLLPQEKLQIFEENKKEKSAFVGDGINDAPVLSSADVGISMGISGSDLSKESSDVVLVNDDLQKILQALDIAKKTKTITTQNIVFALGIKGVFIVLGIFGVAGMWEAVFGDVGVALLALANASRVLR